ncbi:MAG: aldehyde dehydrogenase family protein, partial [Chlamydiia bacterium]|nr:aldehyde dehydrogenase family protein [Chlamydiia bacterium]
LHPGTPIWEEQAGAFFEGCQIMERLPANSRRTQNRLLSPPYSSDVFQNEPDTDFALKENRQWIEKIFLEAEGLSFSPLPLVIEGEEIHTVYASGIDPSRPNITLYHYSLADVPLIEKAIACSLQEENVWGSSPFQTRSALLKQIAHLFRQKRGDLIGIMIADGGKTVQEADTEISEAIDFIEYYRLSSSTGRPKGTILVTPPWNFPCSIPVGGIAAALIAGNCILFKPAPEVVLIGWHIAKLFWEGGISKRVLQFINCKEDPVGSYLVKHPHIDGIILTGATETAKKFLRMHPGIELHAETGGKNALIVTAMSDRDLAIRDLVHSAFGHAGQKCSACSLAILEKEVYHDPHFKRQLLDATKSLKVGSAWNPSTKVPPLIHPPEGSLYRALTQLEEGESWLLKPIQDIHNPH